MHRFKKQLLILSLVALGMANHLVPQELETFDIPAGRPGGLGGTHAAFDTGFSALFSNPAGLSGAESEFSVSEITVRSTGPIFSIAGLVSQVLGGEDLTVLLASPSVGALLLNLYSRVSVLGPISFGYVGDGMGFGLYNVSELIAQTSGVGGIEARLGQRIVLRGGYGLAVPLPESWNSDLSLGISVKAYVRGDVVISSTLLGLPTLVGSLGLDTLGTYPFELRSGIGLGVGVRYEWNDLLAGAIVVDDIYTPTATLPYASVDDFVFGTGIPAGATYQTLPQDISFGLAFTPSLGETVDRYIQDVTVLLDYKDAFDFLLDPANSENFALKFGLGLELTLLEILDLRGGFSEGLFAAGMGLDLSVVELDVAMYGTELSAEPGLRPSYNIVIGLEF